MDIHGSATATAAWSVHRYPFLVLCCVVLCCVVLCCVVLCCVVLCCVVLCCVVLCCVVLCCVVLCCVVLCCVVLCCVVLCCVVLCCVVLCCVVLCCVVLCCVVWLMSFGTNWGPTDRVLFMPVWLVNSLLLRGISHRKFLMLFFSLRESQFRIKTTICIGIRFGQYCCGACDVVSHAKADVFYSS